MTTGTRGQPHRWAWRLGLMAVAAALVAGLLLGPYQFLLGNVTGSAAGPAPLAPCLPGEPVEIMDSPHLPPSEIGGVAYNSLPPTSGPHFAFTIAPGVYQEPVPDGLAIHALEHGRVVIRYAPDLDPREVAALTGVARRHGTDVVLSPYPPLAGGIALTAWGRIDRLDRYDERRVIGFVEAMRGRYDHGWVRDDGCPAG